MIEILIVTGLTVLLMMTVTSLFLTFISSSSQAETSQQVKTEGDQALGQMEHLIRNAKSLATNDNNQVCATNMSSLGVEDSLGHKAILRQSNDQLASYSATTDRTYFLSSDQLTIDNNYDLEFDCYEGDNAYFIQIQFGLKAKNAVSSRSITPQFFSAGVHVRNYSQLN